jgi:hypothetical protein
MGRELIYAKIFTNLFRVENKHILQYLKKINIRERTTISTHLFRGEN